MFGRPFFHLVMAALLASVFASVSVAQTAPGREIAPLPREKAFNSDRSTWKITLKECIAIALEQGNVEFKASGLPGSTPEFQQVQPANGQRGQGLMACKLQLDLQINCLLVNVEVAYWNLFAAHRNLSAQEEGLQKAFLNYRFTDTRVLIGSEPSQNRDRARDQFERFRRQVIDARGQVQESERQLRGLLGMRSGDGMRLIPSDEPNLALVPLDFQKASGEALAHRPELLGSRLDLKARQRKLVELKRLEKTDLVPEAELSAKRSHIQLHETELKVLEYLVQQYRQVIQTHADIAPVRVEREALQAYIAKIDTQIALGKWNPQDFLNYLTVQQQLATAISTEYQAIANYKNAMATFEFAKGTIQQYNNLPAGE
jgi:outer membrane protein TolC